MSVNYPVSVTKIDLEPVHMQAFASKNYQSLMYVTKQICMALTYGEVILRDAWYSIKYTHAIQNLDVLGEFQQTQAITRYHFEQRLLVVEERIAAK